MSDRTPAARILGAIGLTLTLSACGTVYSSGETVTAEITGVWTESALATDLARRSPVERAAIAAAVPATAVRAGRAVQYACAEGTDSSTGGNAIAPEGLALKRGDTVTIAVGDAGRGVPNRVTSRITDPRKQRLTKRAYEFIPDWRERGLWNNFERAPVEPWVERNYAIVYGGFLIRCRQD